jgi:hypothetical protein
LPRPTTSVQPQKKKKKKKKKKEEMSYFKVISHTRREKRHEKHFGQDNRPRKADSDQRFTE